MKKHYLLLALILFVVFLLRFPSLFEPFWYGDEGIFAAVANNLNQGGVLYQTAWDNKPPMIYLTYAAIFKIFGVSMFWLRLVTAVAVVATAVALYEIAQKILGQKRALAAALVFGVLTPLRFVEGNLALTEIFMILPITLAMMIAVLRNFDARSLFFSGVLLAIGSLYKQVGALEAGALGIFVFLASTNWNQFVKKGLVLTAGFTLPYLVFALYFASKNLLGEYIFAAYTYYRIYLEESPQYAFLINLLKFLPIAAAAAWGLVKKSRREKVATFHLVFLWMAFSFLGSFFSGRTYGHYLVQAVPAVSLLLAASVPWPSRWRRTGWLASLRPLKARFAFGDSRSWWLVAFIIPIIFLTKILFLNQVGWFSNFGQFAFGNKGAGEYNDYFDRNVGNIMALRDFLAERGDLGNTVYIWGDYPWLYAIADLKNPSRYVTSFHVFGVPGGREEVIADLDKNPPKYIIKPEGSIGYFAELEQLLAGNYELVMTVETSQVYERGSYDGR